MYWICFATMRRPFLLLLSRVAQARLVYSCRVHVAYNKCIIMSAPSIPQEILPIIPRMLPYIPTINSLMYLLCSKGIMYQIINPLLPRSLIIMTQRVWHNAWHWSNTLLVSNHERVLPMVSLITMVTAPGVTSISREVYTSLIPMLMVELERVRGTPEYDVTCIYISVLLNQFYYSNPILVAFCRNQEGWACEGERER